MTRIFLDSADLDEMRRYGADERVEGFTTNPSLARAAGVTDYSKFCREALALAEGRPVSLEVIGDAWPLMARQARRLASFGENAVVKIPITNTRGESASDLIRHLSESGVTVNVTAVFTERQVSQSMLALRGFGYVSVFAGRIADAGGDYARTVQYAAGFGKADTIWASTRQVRNLLDARRLFCAAITLTPALFDKLDGLGRDLREYSLDTVRMFYRDATAAGFEL